MNKNPNLKTSMYISSFELAQPSSACAWFCTLFLAQHKMANMAKFYQFSRLYRVPRQFQFKLYRESNFKNDNCHGFQNPRFKRPPSDWEILMYHLFKSCQLNLISCRANFTTKTYKFSILVRLENTFGNYPDFWLLIKIN